MGHGVSLTISITTYYPQHSPTLSITLPITLATYHYPNLNLNHNHITINDNPKYYPNPDHNSYNNINHDPNHNHDLRFTIHSNLPYTPIHPAP